MPHAGANGEHNTCRYTKRHQVCPCLFCRIKRRGKMALISGIGENKLRQLMADGELEFIQNGNRRLISEQAIWDYYNRAKTPARSVSGGC